MKKRTTNTFLTLFSGLILAVSFGLIAHAQQNSALPSMPEPIKNLVDEGAQVRFLGRDYGFDSWLTIKNGQEQYFYVLPSGEAFVMGVLFDAKGKLVTVDQVQRLRGADDGFLDTLAEDSVSRFTENKGAMETSMEFKSPSERLYNDIENSNWVNLGTPGAPLLYAFIDPQCPHCHAFLDDLRDDIEKGRVNVRIIPVGFRDETRAQAAFLIAAPDPEARWFRHMDGDETALPAKSELSQQGVQKNLAIMQSWKFDATPMIVYRGKDSTVKIVQGRPKNLKAMVADLGTRS